MRVLTRCLNLYASESMPWWVLMWFCSVAGCRNTFPHSLQANSHCECHAVYSSPYFWPPPYGSNPPDETLVALV